MEVGTGGKKGQDYTNKLSNSIGSQRDTISGGEAKVVREEARLCGGCNSLGARQVFSSEQWKKEDAWSREYARRCKRCEEREEREGREGAWQSMLHDAGRAPFEIISKVGWKNKAYLFVSLLNRYITLLLVWHVYESRYLFIWLAFL